MRTWAMFGVALVSGCIGVQGSGVEAEEIREIDGFDGVENRTSVPVNVAEGDAFEVRVYCDDNLIDLLGTELRDGSLRVATRPNTGISPRADCGVDVVAPRIAQLENDGSGELVATGRLSDLRDVANSGSGTLRVEGDTAGLRSVRNSGSGGVLVDALDSDDLDVKNSGSGNLTLRGTGGFASLENSGSGTIQAADLSVGEADVRNSGSGNTSVTVTDFASVRLSGSGDVHVSGGAEVDADDSGSGNVYRD